MDNWLLLAAQVHRSASADVSLVRQVIDLLWEQITVLTWFQAVLAISFGVVYLLYGWRIFRVLVVICFGMIGMFLGMKAGERFGNVPAGGLAGTAVFAFLAVPLMKWCVSFLGAAAGGLITSGIWYACRLPEQYIWAGAVIGIVAGGMISFILLKASVMLFTSLGGSLITLVGVLALLHEYEMNRPEPTHYIEDLIYLHPWFLPTVIIVPTLIGMFIQHKFIQHSSKWDIK